MDPRTIPSSTATLNSTIPRVEDIPLTVLRELFEQRLDLERQNVALGYRGAQEARFPIQPTSLRNRAIRDALVDALKALDIIRVLGRAALARLAFQTSQREEQARHWAMEGLDPQRAPDPNAFYVSQVYNLVSQSIDSLDDAIRKEENQISFLHSQEQELLHSIDHLNSLLPFAGIPTEIWQHIFQIYKEEWNVENLSLPMNSQTDPILVLSSVCRSWRNMILGRPTLFSTINLRYTKARRLAKAMERYANKLGYSRSVVLHLPEAPIHTELSAYSAQFHVPGIDRIRVDGTMRGQDVRYVMYDASKVESMTIDSRGPSPCHLMLKTWNLTSLQCTDIIPILYPSATNSLTKLSITIIQSTWDNRRFSQLLKTISNLTDLTVARFSTRQQTLVIEPDFQNQLHCLRITPEDFNSAGEILCVSPWLRRLGLFVSDGLPRDGDILPAAAFIQLNDFPTIYQNITYLELCAYQGSFCLTTRTVVKFLQQFQRLRTLHFTGTGFTSIVNALAISNEVKIPLDEAIFCDCDVAGAVVVEFLSCKAVTSRSGGETGFMQVERVVLDRCTEITQAHCDLIAARVSKLIVY